MTAVGNVQVLSVSSVSAIASVGSTTAVIEYMPGDVLEVSESIWPADRVMFLDEYDIPADPETEDPKESQI